MTDQPTPKPEIHNSEPFRLGIDCQGVIWRDLFGWNGCLRWDIEGDTDFVGPLLTRQEAIDAVKDNFINAIK